MSINRWILKYGPQLDGVFPHPNWPVWLSWRIDETSKLGFKSCEAGQGTLSHIGLVHILKKG